MTRCSAWPGSREDAYHTLLGVEQAGAGFLLAGMIGTPHQRSRLHMPKA
jgi:hypothetical protein